MSWWERWIVKWMVWTRHCCFRKQLSCVMVVDCLSAIERGFVNCYWLFLQISLIWCIVDNSNFVQLKENRVWLFPSKAWVKMMWCWSVIMDAIPTKCHNIFSHCQKNAPSKALYLISSALIILCVPVRLAHFATEKAAHHGGQTGAEEGLVHILQTIEETMLIIAVPCAWCMLLFFAK